MVRKVQVTRLKEQIHKLHDERDDFQLREAKLTQENSRYDDTLRCVTLRYVTLHFKFRHCVLEKWPKIFLFVLRRQIYLNLQSWTKVLGQFCICRTFLKSHMPNPSPPLPSPNNNFGCRRGSRIFLEFKHCILCSRENFYR